MTDTGVFAVGTHRARWVRPGEQRVQLPAQGPYLARTTLRLDAIPARVVVRATALGMYDLHVNGHRVGDALYRPGWTDVTSRIQYQTYDVTDRLQAGVNVVGAEVAPGWYGGRISTDGDAFLRPGRSELLVAVVAEADDKSELLAGTDEGWEWAPSEILRSDLYDGETVDRRLHVATWTDPTALDLGRWERMELSAGTSGELVAQAGPVVRATHTYPVHAISWLADGSALVDTARNETGYLRLVVNAGPGSRVTVDYGELVDVDGHVYKENLRRAGCRDTFVCAGGEREVLAPRFTYRGFRYAQVSGLPDHDALVAVERVIVGSDVERVGWFESSDPMLNQIYEAVLTSQRANFVEVPTDCPQRDERLGWLADALLFAPVAAYNYDVSGLLSKWLDDVLDARTPAGLFTDIAPRPSGRASFRNRPGAPAWADAGVSVPWLLYQRYGDGEILERMFPAMLTWLQAVHAANPEGIWQHGRGNDYGDWVPAGPDTSHDLFATCWLYHSTRVAAEVAAVVGADEDGAWLASQAAKVRSAFTATFLDEGSGRVAAPHPVGSPVAARRFAPMVAEETQTGYILPLVFGLVEGEVARRSAQRLADLVDKAGRRLETGFIGSAFLLDALAGGGHPQLALELLQRDEFPSLGYMVTRGATSIWERWDGIQPGGGPACPTMNSFNHYALGSMFRWAIESLCGLKPSPDVVAFERFGFSPIVSPSIDWASFRFKSPAGELSVRWDRSGDDEVVGEVVVPAGATCSVAVEISIGSRRAQLVAAAGDAPVDGATALGPGTHRVRWRA